MDQHELTTLQNDIIEDIRTTIGMENTGLIPSWQASEAIRLKLEKYHFSRLLIAGGYDVKKVKEILQ